MLISSTTRGGDPRRLIRVRPGGAWLSLEEAKERFEESMGHHAR